MKTPLVDKPLGPSRLRMGRSWNSWNNLGSGTTRALTCEICGTEHAELPENHEDRIYSRFLGLQVVEECCGRIFDLVYHESAEEFVHHFLEEFADDPTNPQFSMIMEHILPDILKKAAEKLAKSAASVENLQTDLAQSAEAKE